MMRLPCDNYVKKKKEASKKMYVLSIQKNKHSDEDQETLLLRVKSEIDSWDVILEGDEV
ncbi:MAG: hypothetical protein AAGE84_31565 [Cyanobacteria bacterium P01_G01_bin.39]